MCLRYTTNQLITMIGTPIDCIRVKFIVIQECSQTFNRHSRLHVVSNYESCVISMHTFMKLFGTSIAVLNDEPELTVPSTLVALRECSVEY